MKIQAHLIDDAKVFQKYFGENSEESPEIMVYIESHTRVVFSGILSVIPSAFAFLDVNGRNVEVAVVADILDVSNPDAPILHLIVQPTMGVVELVDETKKKASFFS